MVLLSPYFKVKLNQWDYFCRQRSEATMKCLCKSDTSEGLCRRLENVQKNIPTNTQSQFEQKKNLSSISEMGTHINDVKILHGDMKWRCTTYFDFLYVITFWVSKLIITLTFSLKDTLTLNTLKHWSALQFTFIIILKKPSVNLHNCREALSHSITGWIYAS